MLWQEVLSSLYPKEAGARRGSAARLATQLYVSGLFDNAKIQSFYNRCTPRANFCITKR